MTAHSYILLGALKPTDYENENTKIMYEIFIENFTNDDELTPIDIVQDITGLSHEEIMRSESFIKIQIDEQQHFDDPRTHGLNNG